MNLVKRCRVCNDEASGFNYEALSCESCKVFFCRNSSRLEILDCFDEENCSISIETRSSCAKCRLAKCFAIGMKRRQTDEGSSSSSSNEPKSPQNVDIFLEISLHRLLTDYDLKQVKQYVHSECSIVELPKKRPTVALTQFEQEYLTMATNAIRIFSPENAAHVIIHTANNFHQLIESSLPHNLLYLKKSINFGHTFPAFNTLPNRDQLAILKPFALGVMQIRSAFHLMELNGMLLFTDETESEAIFIGEKFRYKDRDFQKKLARYFLALHKVMESDVHIRDLISAILLFKLQHNVTNPENIKYYYYLYSLILRRYLQSKYHSKKEGNRKYLVLCKRLDQLEMYLAEYKAMMISEFGVENMPGILRELYDVE